MVALHKCTHTARAGPRAVFRILSQRPLAVSKLRRFSVCGGRFIEGRFLDRTHRSLTHSLQREVSRYQGSFTLDPTIRHFLVQYQMAGKDKLHEVKIPVKKTIVTKHSYADILESVVHCILCCTIPVGASEEQVFSKHNEARRQNLLHIQKQLKAARDLDEQRVAEDVLVIMSNIRTEPTGQAAELLRLCVEMFHMVNVVAGLDYSVESDLVPWLESIRSSRVKEACMALNNAVAIPAFVLNDILLRTPMTRYELYLQLDLWYNFEGSIAKALHNRRHRLKEVISNMVFYTTQYDIHKLPELLQRIISFFTSNSTGYTFKLIDANFINQYVWQIALDFTTAPKTNTLGLSSIIKAQELLVKCLDHNQKLSLTGHMGITLIVSYMSPEKSLQLFRVAQTKFFDADPQPQELMPYHFVRIMLTSTPDQLLQAFNEAMSWNEKSSTLWLAFVKKLHTLELLNTKRSVQIAERLVDHSDSLILSKNILLHLMLPINSIEVLRAFTNQLARAPAVLRANTSILMSKYMSILYKGLDEKNPVISHLQEQNAEIIPQGETALYIARAIYNDAIAKKTSRVVGNMLNGEVQVQPQKIHQIYKQELSNNNLFPDETCLTALMKGALIRTDPHNENSCFVWDNLYAPQIAIVEFKKNVVRHKFSATLDSQIDEDFDRVYPSDELWRAYITLLHQYNYMSELSEIIKWWEDIEFVPQHRTLTMLLKALPPEFAQRYIKHADATKVSSPGTTRWPWPTPDELA